MSARLLEIALFTLAIAAAIPLFVLWLILTWFEIRSTRSFQRLKKVVLPHVGASRTV